MFYFFFTYMITIGFCGVDESVSPQDIISLSNKHIEWGVLFRPEKEKQPRFPSMEWVRKLCKMKTDDVRLAGHLCSSRCEQVLSGDSSFVKELYKMGFRRVQVNATIANGVNYNLHDTNLLKCIKEVKEIEWIIQFNEETRPLYEHVILHYQHNNHQYLIYNYRYSLGDNMCHLHSIEKKNNLLHLPL